MNAAGEKVDRVIRVEADVLNAKWGALVALKGRYVWGAKSDSMFVTNFNDGIDCSGYTRYAARNLTAGSLELVDGSIAQEEQLGELGFVRVPYLFAANERSGHIFQAFWDGGVGRQRHTWLVRDGMTAESYSPRGPATRKPLSAVFLRMNDRARIHCFRLITS